MAVDESSCTGNHAEHICALATHGKMSEIKLLTKEANFLCGKCGREV
jgi:hypothetical protein